MINLIFSITIVICTVVIISHLFQIFNMSGTLQGNPYFKKIQENEVLFFALNIMKTLCANEFFKDGKLLTQEEIFKMHNGLSETDLSDAEKEYVFKIISSQLCMSQELSGVVKYKLSTTPTNEKFRAQLSGH